MRRLNKVMEGFWLVLAVCSAAWALGMGVRDGLDEGLRWAWFPVIAVGMFFYRRFMRRKLEAMDREGHT
jgi:hypothetical protein